jgi:hydroxymethylglutaryl-CoA lyase
MSLPKKIYVREVGPREGFQILQKVISTADKLTLINALIDAGLGEIEVTSFVNPKRVPQMADAEELVSKLQKSNSVKYYGLYLNQTGFVRAEKTGKLDNKAWLNCAFSDQFLQNNANSSIQGMLDSVPEWLKAFDSYGKQFYGILFSTAFGCSYEGRITISKARNVMCKLKDCLSKNNVNEVHEICLADTIGWGTPLLVKEMIFLTREVFPIAKVSMHFHDTRGCGIANVYSALEEGIDCFDSSIGGLGGCPFAHVTNRQGAAGNIATEDLVYLCEEMGIETGINLSKLVIAAKLAEQITGTRLMGHYAYT